MRPGIQKGCGALHVNPTQVNDFSRGCLNLRPKCIILTHLQEFGGHAADYWDVGHAEMICSKIRELWPAMPAIWAVMGDRFSLWVSEERVLCPRTNLAVS